jgi:hypothetical protein
MQHPDLTSSKDTRHLLQSKAASSSSCVGGLTRMMFKNRVKAGSVAVLIGSIKLYLTAHSLQAQWLDK